jgi:GNAT superfamily N-acetyltransferase
MITFKNLCKLGQEQLLSCFNEAFSAYIIPLQLSPELFAWKLKSEHFQPELSVGAFDGEKLVGFILHCYDEEYEKGRVYNGGTGVLEAYRGRQLTRKMYDYILPILKTKGFHTALLEVIEGNEPAHQSYLKAGFATKRVLAAFKGNLSIIKYNIELTIEEGVADLYDYNFMATTAASWQNAQHSLNRVGDTLRMYTGLLNSEPVAYLVYNPLLKRVHQLAVAPNCRRKGVGSAMMHHIQIKYPETISVINVDDKDDASIAFLKKSGLASSINLFEMEMPI